jgi:hypothetical protein
MKLDKGLCLLFLSLTILVGGCSTKGSYIPTSNAKEVAADSIFSIGEITDSSGFEFPADQKEVIVLKDAMREALKKALAAKGALGEAAAEEEAEEAKEVEAAVNYSLNVNIVSYAPGNAFARWLLPGAGATKLGVLASVLAQDGVLVAKMPVERSIGFGGAYTVGAWKHVFDEVATEIADYLTNPAKRQGQP